MQKLLSDQRDFYDTHITKSVAYRLSRLRTLRKIIIEKEQDIIQAIYKDFRKSEFEVLSTEIGVVLSELNKTIKNLKKWSKPKSVLPSILNFPSTSKIYKEPYGSVLIIAPWNYPFNLAIIPLIGAVAGGNTVILKPSELTENTSKILNEIVNKVFDHRHVAVIQGGVKVSQDLLKEKWDYIFFTGSVQVGKIVNKMAAEYLTPVTLELGGKSPTIVDKSASLKHAAKRIVWGKFINGGQTCIAPDYIMVHNEVLNELITLMIKEIEIAYGIDPKESSDFPRIINASNFVRLTNMLENVDVVYGGKTDKNENYISPTILKNPPLDSNVMQEEIFGPILPVLGYDNQNQIEDLLKQYPNPLSLYIFSKNKKFQEHFINNYSFGGGTINDTIVHFINDRLPFGGVGDSGIGSYHGKHSYDAFTRNKSIVKRYNWLDIPIRYLPSTEMKKKLIKFFLTR